MTPEDVYDGIAASILAFGTEWVSDIDDPVEAFRAGDGNVIGSRWSMRAFIDLMELEPRDSQEREPITWMEWAAALPAQSSGAFEDLMNYFNANVPQYRVMRFILNDEVTDPNMTQPTYYVVGIVDGEPVGIKFDAVET